MLTAVRNIISASQICSNIMKQQTRTTFILKRKNPARLHKKDGIQKSLRSRHFIYELVKDTTVEKHQLMKVILATNVEGVGNKGEIVEVKPNFAYNNLILMKKAIYASDENVEKYAKEDKDNIEEKPTSPFVPLCMQSLSKMVLSVVMNKDTKWTLKTWHIRTSFRKCGWEVPDSAIFLPEQPIQGPDMKLENKQFTIVVQFSPHERQEVTCRIHHWSTDPSERLPYIKEFWKTSTESVFSINKTEEKVY